MMRLEKREIWYLCVCLFLHIFIVAAPAQERTDEEVREAVYSYFYSNSFGQSSVWHMPPRRIKDTLIVESICRNGISYLYAVNVPQGGWALVSNEKKYTTILGYSTDEFFDTDTASMPGALKLLLEHHMNMIDSLRQDGDSVFYSRKNIVPYVPLCDLYIQGDTLLRHGEKYNVWGQTGNNDNFSICSKSYSKYAPTNHNNDSCGRTWVGCGAVAMGQLMWYWRWPDSAVIPDTIHNLFLCICGVPSTSKHRHYYDWDNIPHGIYYYTEVYAADNVAKLLRDCGYAAKTFYAGGGSAAMIGNINSAMQDVFNFHTRRYHEYPKTDMDPIIKREIDSLRPVLCQAWNNDDGLSAHTFIIDGYKIVDGENNYHINFGWSGKESAWYDLGFYGYDGNRTFLIEVYPDCSARQGNAYNDTDTIIENGGTLTYYSTQSIVLGGIGNELTIKNGGHLIAEAGNMIALIGGFRAEYSSHVRLGIRDFCAETGINIRRAPNITAEIEDEAETNAAEDDIAIKKVKVSEKDVFSTYPNPAVNVLNISSNKQITEATIFNLSGQKVLHTSDTEVDVSVLPEGMYILRVQTTDGYIYQDKFIKAVR